MRINVTATPHANGMPLDKYRETRQSDGESRRDLMDTIGLAATAAIDNARRHGIHMAEKGMTICLTFEQFN